MFSVTQYQDQEPILHTILSKLKCEPNIEGTNILLQELWEFALGLLHQQDTQSQIEQTENTLQLIVNETLEAMLSIEWYSTNTTNIKTKIGKCIKCMKYWPHLVNRCLYMVNTYIDHPWDNTILKIIMYTTEECEKLQEQFKQEKVLFELEQGNMIVLRICKLIESESDEYALNFCRKAMKAMRSITNVQTLRDTISAEQHQFLQGAYMSLLFKYKKFEELRNEILVMDEKEIRNFVNGSIETVRKAQKQQELSTYPLQVSVTLLNFQMNSIKYSIETHLMQLMGICDDDNSQEKLDFWLDLWFAHHKDEIITRDKVNNLMVNSFSTLQTYLVCEKLYNYLPNELKLCIETYCMALSLDIKCWQDEKKQKKPYDAAKVKEMQENIASRFLFLAKILRDHAVVVRECILIAFLLQSSKEHYDLLLIIARQLYPHLRINDFGEATIADNGYDSNEITPTATLLLLLSETIREKIAPLLLNTNLKFLSWDIAWTTLNQYCRILMALGIVNDKVSISHSKFVFEEYKQFLNRCVTSPLVSIEKFSCKKWNNVLLDNQVKLRKHMYVSIPLTDVGKRFEIVELPVEPRLGQPGRYTNQLQFLLETVMQVIWKHPCSEPFRQPVNTKNKNALDYYFTVKKPMDLLTIKARLEHHYYINAKEAITDFLQIFSNCYMYYGKLDPIVSQANILKVIFEEQIQLMPKIEIEMLNFSTNSSLGNSQRQSKRLLKLHFEKNPIEQILGKPTKQAAFLSYFQLTTHQCSDLIKFEKSTHLPKRFGIGGDKKSSDRCDVYLQYKNNQRYKRRLTSYKRPKENVFF